MAHEMPHWAQGTGHYKLHQVLLQPRRLLCVLVSLLVKLYRNSRLCRRLHPLSGQVRVSGLQQMSRIDEQGAAQDIKMNIRENLKTLHIDQQHIQQTAQALCSNSSFG